MDYTSFISHRLRLPSPLACSVMSVSYNLFAAVAVIFRFTRSSCTAGPGLFPWPRLLPKLLKICWLQRSRPMPMSLGQPIRLSQALKPSAGISPAISTRTPGCPGDAVSTDNSRDS